MSFNSDELNYLIYRYLKEAGFEHSAFSFGNESRVAVDRISVAPSEVVPGTLVYVVQKGLQYLEVESAIAEDGTEFELEDPISLLTPYNVKRKAPKEDKKDKKRKREEKEEKEKEKERKETKEKPGKSAKKENNNMIVDDDVKSENGKKSKETKEKEKDSSRTQSAKATPSPVTPTTPLSNSANSNNIQVPQTQATTLEGHTSEVFMCSWNPKLSIIASGSADNTARYWNVPDGPCGKKSADETMKTSQILKHTNTSKESKDVTTIDWNSAGTYLATGTLDGVARIWDLKGKCKFKLEEHLGAIFALKWSRNGDYLLSGSVDSSAIVWDATTGLMKQQFKYHSDAILDVDWKNADTFASCSSDRAIFVSQIGRSDHVCEFLAHEDEVNAIRWSPDGRILASCSDDKTAKLWTLDSTSPIHNLTDHKKEIYTIKWSPTGPGTKNPNSNLLLATASFDSTVKLWDVEQGKCVQTLSKHVDPVYSVAFSPCGQYIASGSIDRYIYIYSVKDGKLVKSFRGSGGIFEVCWNSVGDKVAACFSNNVVSVIDFKM
jgi:transducin (beta)-like 1